MLEPRGYREASRKIGAEFRVAHPEIPWREMNDLRNVLIHNYEGADPALVWGIVNREGLSLTVGSSAQSELLPGFILWYN